MNSDLQTARDYLKSNVRLVIWCKGDVPIVRLKFVCANSGSRLTDCAVTLNAEEVAGCVSRLCQSLS
jgi:hypothetical protein